MRVALLLDPNSAGGEVSPEPTAIALCDHLPVSSRFWLLIT